MSKIYVIHPTSCRCGGNLAWLEVLDGGGQRMIGCVCHHTPKELIGSPLELCISDDSES